MAVAPLIITAHVDEARMEHYEMNAAGIYMRPLHAFIAERLPRESALKEVPLSIFYRGRDITYIPASCVPDYYGFREAIVVKERAREYSIWEQTFQFLFR